MNESQSSVSAPAEEATLYSDDDSDSDSISIAKPDAQFTLRALILGLVLGILVNLSNTYYGLQVGISSQMPLITGLLGYLTIQSLKRYSVTPLSVGENVLIMSAATATGCMPVTAGFTGVIPAVEFVLHTQDGGKWHFQNAELLLWSFGLAFFGIAFAIWLRDRFVEKSDAPWPGPKATARMIFALHSGSGDVRTDARTDDSRQSVVYSSISDGTAGRPASFDTILRFGAASFGVAILTHFMPILRQIPIFGLPAARIWLWSFNASPGFVGQGIITGLAIPLHMMSGAIVGWAILSPLAIHRGWAHGPVDDWETGSRSWIMWVSLSCLMADAGVFMIWYTVGPIFRALQKQICTYGHTNRTHAPIFDLNEDNQRTTRSKILSGTIVAVGLTTLSVGICILSVYIVFDSIIPWYLIIFAIFLALPMALVGIKALAECDFNPESGLLSQLVFAAILNKSKPHALLTNLVSAGLASACASQAGDISYDFKIGSLVQANSNAQIYGHVIGSAFGSLIATGMYRLYTSTGNVPGPVFQIPAAYLSVNTSKLILGQGLPDGVAPFALSFGIFFFLVAITKLCWPVRWWHSWLPSGTAFAIGMANTPSFTLPRVVGGATAWLYMRRLGGDENKALGIGTGLILGETLGSVLMLIIAAFLQF